jgi:hypothetical protein
VVGLLAEVLKAVGGLHGEAGVDKDKPRVLLQASPISIHPPHPCHLEQIAPEDGAHRRGALSTGGEGAGGVQGGKVELKVEARVEMNAM